MVGTDAMQVLHQEQGEPVGDVGRLDGQDVARVGNLRGGRGRDGETGVPTGSTASGYRAFDLFMLAGESGVTSTRKGEILPVTRRFRELLA